MKVAVVSAVNFSEGGPLTVLRECLDAASRCLGPEWEVVALVHQCRLVENSRVKCLEFPKSKGSWLERVVLEWWGFRKLSGVLKPDLWLSLHDMSPRVVAKRQAVYCHNPSPFYDVSLREGLFDPKLVLFRVLYGYLYGLNIHSNRFVVVQQEWIRDAFRKRYAHPMIVVAHPQSLGDEHLPKQSPDLQKTIFLYPALPRVFKNIETLCRAMQTLPRSVCESIELRLTLDGSENRYARWLVREFGAVQCVRFIGRQNRNEMKQQYSDCDAVLFPSKLETWGLPITESKAMGKDLLVADLPYAREAVGDYGRVSFIGAEDARAWGRAISAVASRSWVPQGNTAVVPRNPYAANWTELWALLTEGL